MAKKIIPLLIVCCLFSQRIGFGQGAPVIDASHIATSTAGFSLSLTQTINSVTTLLEELAILKKNAETVKYMKDLVGTLNKYIYNMQEIINATQSIIEITKVTKDTYTMALRSGNFSLDEITQLSNSATQALRAAVTYTDRMKQVLDPDAWKMNDFERTKVIEETDAAITKIKNNCEDIYKRVELENKNRKLLNELAAAGALSPIEARVMGAIPQVRITLGMQLAAAIMNSPAIPRYDSESTDTAESAKRKTTPLFAKLKGLFLIITAFVAFFGAFRVYRQIQLGEDIGKSIAIWTFSVLLIFILIEVTEIIIGT